MKKIYRCFIVVALFMLSGNVISSYPSNIPPEILPTWLSHACFYQVYPQSFKDTNGDGIGDLNGVGEKLGYIQSLGCNAIWMNPCFESAYQDAGYDVTDYYKVGQRYGTNDDLKRLISKAHRLGIKVCLDLVAGHTSNQHPWFKISSSSTNNEYSDRYIWTSSKKIKPGDKWVTGDYSRDGNYLKNYFEVQPALNYGYAHPDKNKPWEEPVSAEGPTKMKNELKKIIAFWMDMGVDGFRVDMASSLIKGDPDFVETNKLWGGIRQWFCSRYPEGVLIAEWSNPEESIKAGFMIDFMMHFNVKGYPSLFFNKAGKKSFYRDTCFFSAGGNGTVTEFLKNYLHQREAVNGKGYISLPTANHDFSRLNVGDRDTPDQLKVAMTFLLTMPGIPFIYYGDEIGMRYVPGTPDREGAGVRAGSRTPMQWDCSDKAGFSTADTSEFYLPLDPNKKRPCVSSEQQDSNSLLNFTRQLIKIRQNSHALCNDGEFVVLYAQDHTYPFVYLT